MSTSAILSLYSPVTLPLPLVYCVLVLPKMLSGYRRLKQFFQQSFQRIADRYIPWLKTQHVKAEVNIFMGATVIKNTEFAWRFKNSYIGVIMPKTWLRYLSRRGKLVILFTFNLVDSFFLDKCIWRSDSESMENLFWHKKNLFMFINLCVA